MSAVFNGTLPLPVADSWANMLPQSKGKLALLLVLYAPITAVIFNIVWQFIRPRRANEPPVVFHWLPFIGSAASYGLDPLGFFFKNREKYGDVFTFVFFGRRVTAALGPQGNNFVLGGKSTVLSAKEAYTHFTTPVFGTDVVYDAPNEKFMEQKRFVKMGLSTENLRQYVGMIEDEGENFLKHDPTFEIFQRNDINEWGKFDAFKVMSEITILTASRTLQGKEVRAGLDKSFAQLYHDLDGGFTPLNFLFPNLPLESYRKRDRAHKKMSEFYIDIINKRRAGGTDNEHDLIATFMQQSYRDGTTIRDHEIAHLLIGVLMAGQHTSSATGSWALLHIAHNPQIADALYQEQVKHFCTPNGKFQSPTYEELKTLPLLDAVIRETLRMHPPIHSMFRKAQDDVIVPPTLAAPSKDSTYVVPKGYYTLSSPVVSQMDPAIWKEPETWDPYRWIDPDGIAAEAIASEEGGEKVDYGFGAVSKGTESPYLPFGAGRHRCIGEQFAYVQLGTLLSLFVRNLELRIDEMPDNNYRTMITVPKEPRDIHYRRRKFD